MVEIGTPAEYIKPVLKRHGELKQITFSSHDLSKPKVKQDNKSETPAQTPSVGGTPGVYEVQKGYTGGTKAAREAAKVKAVENKAVDKAKIRENTMDIIRKA